MKEESKTSWILVILIFILIGVVIIAHESVIRRYDARNEKTRESERQAEEAERQRVEHEKAMSPADRRMAAIENSNDQTFLIEMAKDRKNGTKTRMMAVEKVEDQTVLEEIIKGETHPVSILRSTAEKRLEELKSKQ